MLAELATYRGHEREVNAACWSPHHESTFVSADAAGSMLFWDVGGGGGPAAEVPGAHDGAVMALAWHPIGQALCRRAFRGLCPQRKWERGTDATQQVKKFNRRQPTANGPAAADCTPSDC